MAKLPNTPASQTGKQTKNNENKTFEELKLEYETALAAKQAQMRDVLDALITIKFGAQRGNKALAARALNVTPSVLSIMLKGTYPIQQRHLDELEALPNADMPEPLEVPPIKKSIFPTAQGWRLIADLPHETHKQLVDILHAHGRSVTTLRKNPEAMTEVLVNMIQFTHKHYASNNLLADGKKIDVSETKQVSADKNTTNVLD